jgi:hypothetical protein
MAQEKAWEQNHSLQIRSGKQTEGMSVDELGEFVMKNGISGKEHHVTLWGSGIMEGDSLQSIALYMNEPEEIARLMDEGVSVDGAASDALIDYTLDDLIRTEGEIWADIEKYAMDLDAEYEHEIPLKDIKVDLHDLIVKEEITDLMMKNDRAAISKEDLLEFGQLVKGDSSSYDVGRELKEPVEKILKERNVESGELDLMKSAFKSLSIDSNLNDFVKEKSRHGSSVPFSNNHLVGKGQKEIEISR